jgi:surface antigen
MKKTLLVLVLAALPAPVLAVNMAGFKEAPITRLSGEELKAYRAIVMRTLNETPDGAIVEWKAPKTRFSSKITPQKTFTDGKRQCREAVVESDAHDRFQRGLYTFCKTEKGDWEFKSPRPAAKK